MSLGAVCSRIIDGKTSTFGTSGYTRNNVFVLYDRSTDSLWYPLKDGAFDAVAGPKKGDQIPFVAKPDPVELAEWVKEHPNTLVLMPPPDRRGFLGVRLGSNEAVIDEVIRGSAADRAGLEDGDLLLKVDDREITESRDLSRALRRKHVGDRITLVVLRNGQEITIDAKLGKRVVGL